MTFDPNQHLIDLKGKQYLEVRWRIAWFRDENPHGSIKTELVAHEPGTYALFKAIVARGGLPNADDFGCASGYGSETSRDVGDYIEKAETKAVGRALAMLGYGTQFAPELLEGDRIVDAPVSVVTNGRVTPSPPPRPASQPQNSPPQQRPQASNTATISEAQIKYLWSLSTQKGWGNDGVYDYIQGTYGKSEVHELSRREASEMLDMLKEQPDAKPAGPRQEPQKGNPQGAPMFEEPKWLATAPPPDADRWTT